MTSRETRQKAEQLIPAIETLRRRALDLEESHRVDLELVATDYQPSARNLLHYLAVRQNDIRAVQKELIDLGLTSLGNAETAVLHTLDSLLVNLHALAGKKYEPPDELVPVTCNTGPMMLDMHTEQLLGRPSGKRRVRIMVTMPSEAATDKRLIQDLLAAGMDVMRINCAHDGPEQWAAMIAHLHDAERKLGRPCKIYADLAGPKLRTGPIQPAGQIVKYRPVRNYRGEVSEMCRVWLTPENQPEPAPLDADVTIPIADGLLDVAEVGDAIELIDARGRHRELDIISRSNRSCLAETDRTHYAETGMPVRLVREDEVMAESVIGQLPDLVLPIQLQTDDLLVLTRELVPGQPARYDEEGNLIQHAHIGCTLREAFSAADAGDRVLFDDGKIHGRVLENDGERITVKITHTGLNGAKLRAEKGINFPDTKLTMPSLTAKDLQDLDFMVKHADVVGLSFVRFPVDVNALEEQLRRLGALNIGVVLKIETRQGFENLPRLLLSSMRTPPDGVMVARGDLAAEVGFERMAEVQEEILWFCEAAHIPVIWATQVLESLAKRGAPSRAEVTDVVMSGQAECVMLNKGPYIVETVRFLSGVLERMAAHRSKRRDMLRRLSVSKVD